MMTDWREILMAFLEGRGSREELNGLLLKIDLPEHARRDIRGLLLLVDWLDSGLRQIPSPSGPPPQLLEQLRAAALPAQPAPEAESSADDAEAALGRHLLDDRVSRAALEVLLRERGIAPDVGAEIQDVLFVEGLADVEHASLSGACAGAPPAETSLQRVLTWLLHPLPSQASGPSAGQPRRPAYELDRDVRAADKEDLAKLRKDPDADRPPAV